MCAGTVSCRIAAGTSFAFNGIKPKSEMSPRLSGRLLCVPSMHGSHSRRLETLRPPILRWSHSAKCSVLNPQAFQIGTFGTEVTIMRSVFCLAARCTDVAVSAPYLGRAGKQKTDWTKPRARARYGDCIAQPFDRNHCELVRRPRAGAGSDDMGRCSDALAPD